ncbi:MAG: Glycoside hydrolase 15-related protein [Parcubacteria group bacterium GW2011_GWA1_47_8]|nr:MAG: Glycoside hydrolase 15-related protein [Parcubacteria group bacterium GW2011_GWA1_47_8]KKW07833.1 MAG: Glycoside hydrolase 15-related protein [Parcubacteria group bacterium GW2011_GWA2_49_16]
MPKSLSLGNGTMLVCTDMRAQVRDFYFPYVGLENHVGGHYTHRIGVFVDYQLNWFDHSNWAIDINYANESMIGETTAVNKALGVALHFLDTVYNEKNIFLRRVTVSNDTDRARIVKLFFGHEFEIYESHRGDTAYYDPRNHVVIHYNGRRVFLINGISDKGGFDDYTTGIFKIEGKEGSFVDAGDGVLAKNLIEHGPTDSMLGFYLDLAPHEEKTIYYWVAVATSIEGALGLNEYTLIKTPEHLVRTTRDYWHAWVQKNNFNFYGLSEREVTLFRKSLFMVRSHADDHGAIIASADSDMLQKGRDTYSYVWPRDGAFSAAALDMTGDQNVAERFFNFCNDIITKDGYLMHKYRPDGSLGSSWHPWMRGGKIQLPVQEDETALVVHALWNHYVQSKDIEFIERIYNTLIKEPADFMVEYRDAKTHLPRASYDLWEEKFGVHTFTAASVYGALHAAAKFAKLLGKEKSEHTYMTAAAEIREAILTHLYDETQGTFIKMINVDDAGTMSYDKTLDMSSVYGIFAFGVLDIDDERLTRAIGQVESRLLCKTNVSGVARYEGDPYFQITSNVPGNPWIITTLWLAQYYIARAKKEADFEQAKKWLTWATEHASPSGMFPEQLHPYTGEQLSAMPLTWSHAEFITTIVRYLDKLEELGICLKCNPLYSEN